MISKTACLIKRFILCVSDRITLCCKAVGNLNGIYTVDHVDNIPHIPNSQAHPAWENYL